MKTGEQERAQAPPQIGLLQPVIGISHTIDQAGDRIDLRIQLNVALQGGVGVDIGLQHDLACGHFVSRHFQAGLQTDFDRGTCITLTTHLELVNRAFFIHGRELPVLVNEAGLELVIPHGQLLCG